MPARRPSLLLDGRASVGTCVPQMLSSVTADMGTLSMALPFEGYCTCAYKAEDALVIAATLGVKMSSLF